MTQIDNLNLEKITQQLLDTFIEAGNAAKKISKKGVKITIKPDSTPVTDGDMVVNNLLTDKIRALTPEIPIIKLFG